MRAVERHGEAAGYVASYHGPAKPGDERGMIIPEFAVNTLRWWRSMPHYHALEDLVFRQKNGDVVIGRQAPMDSFLRAIGRAGISREGRNLVVHSFRHTYNTLLKDRLPADVLRGFVGHKSIIDGLGGPTTAAGQ